jgi:probable rRNA maturation factor
MSQRRSGRTRTTDPLVTILVEEPMWRADGDVIRTIRRAARLALTMMSGKRDGLSVSILLANDARLRDLNAAFRNQRKTTNVLSFPALPTAPDCLGDVALGYQILCREAAAQNKSLAEHAAHLTIHGVLHLAGYEHERADDALIMENLEISLLTRMGFGDPYTAVPVRRRAKRHKLPLCPRMPAR